MQRYKEAHLPVCLRGTEIWFESLTSHCWTDWHPETIKSHLLLRLSSTHDYIYLLMEGYSAYIWGGMKWCRIEISSIRAPVPVEGQSFFLGIIDSKPGLSSCTTGSGIGTVHRKRPCLDIYIYIYIYIYALHSISHQRKLLPRPWLWLWRWTYLFSSFEQHLACLRRIFLQGYAMNLKQ